MANSSMFLQQISSSTVICLVLHHRAIPPDLLPFSYHTPFSCLPWPGEINPKFVSGISLVNHVSVNSMILHCRYSLWCQVNGSNSSMLLGRDLTFPRMMEGRTCYAYEFNCGISVCARWTGLMLISWEDYYVRNSQEISSLLNTPTCPSGNSFSSFWCLVWILPELLDFINEQVLTYYSRWWV